MSVNNEVKFYVLDTSVLLYDPKALRAFEENVVVIPEPVAQELDDHKIGSEEINYNARKVIRDLVKAAKTKGRGIKKGVPINDLGGTLIVEKLDADENSSALNNDDRILKIALKIAVREKDSGKKVVLVTRDVHLHLMGLIEGIEVEDYENDKVSVDRFYTGYREIVSPEVFEKLSATGCASAIFSPELLLNEMVIIRKEAGTEAVVLGRCVEKGKIVRFQNRESVLGVQCKNVEQRMAMELLLDDNIRLVTLTGPAGTGKTLLTLACSLHKVRREKVYGKILIYRPIVPVGGKDIGALPGELSEKLAPWMEAIIDNLETLANNGKPKVVAGNEASNKCIGKDKGRVKGKGEVEVESETKPWEKYLKCIQMNHLGYIRGRSIPDSIIIIDEAQNLTKEEVKTIITRVADGTKIIVTGDPSQVDSPYLDKSSNGLVYLVDKMKDSKLVGQVHLVKTVRSPLAELAAEKL